MVAQRQLEDTVLIVVKYWFESDSISNTILNVFREFYLSVEKGLFTCLIVYYYQNLNWNKDNAAYLWRQAAQIASWSSWQLARFMS